MGTGDKGAGFGNENQKRFENNRRKFIL